LSSNHKLVEVYRASGEVEALAIKAMLESFGVPSILRSHASSSVHPFSVDGMGEVKVMVWDVDVEKAEELINSKE